MRSLAVAVVLTLGSLSVHAQDAPAERRTASAYVQKVRSGLQQLSDGDVVGAMATFHEAVRDEPNQAAAHCHLASAQRANGDNTDALTSFQTCARLARQGGDAINEGRGLLGAAQILVLDRSRRDEARRAVAALRTFADTHALIFAAPSAQRLQQALDTITELDAVSAEVRRRREERAAQNDS